MLPPVPLSRRMWAGSKITINQPLYLGEDGEKKSRVSSVKLKQGSSGPLVFVVVEHQYLVADELRIMEEQTLVYLDESKQSSGIKQFEQSDQWSKRIHPDPVMLFRYSALTSNSHRIHYDREYSVNSEGNAGLLVHAPLTATLLAELLRERYPALQVKEFSFRALLPLVDSCFFTIHGSLDANNMVSLWARDVDGQLAMQATARTVET